MKLKLSIPMLVLIISLLPAASHATSYKIASPQNTDANAHAFFVQSARIASRPASGSDLYENIQEYMWRNVYMIATVDHLVKTQPWQDYHVFVRTWHGLARLPNVSSNFYSNPSPKFTWDNATIYADAILTLPANTSLPSHDFEFVGTVCGIFQVTQNNIPIQAMPQICIPQSDFPLIRPIPLQSTEINP